MIGVELRDGAATPAAALTDTVLEHMKDAGFLLGKTGPGRNVLTFMPPLIVEQAELDALVERLDEVLAGDSAWHEGVAEVVRLPGNKAGSRTTSAAPSCHALKGEAIRCCGFSRCYSLSPPCVRAAASCFPTA